MSSSQYCWCQNWWTLLARVLKWPQQSHISAAIAECSTLQDTLHCITGYTLPQTSQQCITLSKIGSRHKRIYLLEPERLHISFTQKVPDCIIQQQTINILTFRQCSDASPSCSVLMKGFSIQCNHYSSLGHFWSSWGFWGFRHFDTLTLLYSGPQRWAGSTVFLKIKWSCKEGRVRWEGCALKQSRPCLE